MWGRGGGSGLLANVSPADPAILAPALLLQRPSPKLLAFLRKHFALHNYAPQQNNFVIFDEFFASRPQPTGSIYDSISSRPLTSRGGPPSSWAVRS